MALPSTGITTTLVGTTLGVAKMLFLNGGSIVAVEEITAYG